MVFNRTRKGKYQYDLEEKANIGREGGGEENIPTPCNSRDLKCNYPKLILERKINHQGIVGNKYFVHFKYHRGKEIIIHGGLT